MDQKNGGQNDRINLKTGSKPPRIHTLVHIGNILLPCGYAHNNVYMLIYTKCSFISRINKRDGFLIIVGSLAKNESEWEYFVKKMSGNGNFGVSMLMGVEILHLRNMVGPNGNK